MFGWGEIFNTAPARFLTSSNGIDSSGGLCGIPRHKSELLEEDVAWFDTRKTITGV